MNFNVDEDANTMKNRHRLFEIAKSIVGDDLGQQLAAIVQNPNCITDDALLGLKKTVREIKRDLDQYVASVERLGPTPSR